MFIFVELEKDTTEAAHLIQESRLSGSSVVAEWSSDFLVCRYITSTYIILNRHWTRWWCTIVQLYPLCQYGGTELGILRSLLRPAYFSVNPRKTFS